MYILFIFLDLRSNVPRFKEWNGREDGGLCIG